LNYCPKRAKRLEFKNKLRKKLEHLDNTSKKLSGFLFAGDVVRGHKFLLLKIYYLKDKITKASYANVFVIKYKICREVIICF